MSSLLISIAYAKIQVTPKTTAIDSVLKTFFRDETFFVLVRFWLFFHNTLTVIMTNIVMLVMRIMVTGMMNDHKSGLLA